VKRLLRWLAASAVVTGLAGAAVATWLVLLPGPSSVGPVLLGVAEGERFEDIARALERLGVIRSAGAFRLWARLRGRDRGVSWGDYVLQPPMSPMEVLDRLALPPDPVGRITIPEGLTVAETATLLESHGHGPAARFEAILQDPAFLDRSGLPATGAEGYLFPDTYVFPSTMTPERILEAMVVRFRREFEAAVGNRHRVLGLTPHELVTLASLIEEEAARPEERREISAVFHNRLRIGMRLQSDPTVIYGRRDGDRSISRSDLQRPTPHNTYVVAGLPATPIANPGRGSLEAAADPAPGDALYFVARGDGSHVFSRSLAEHNAAVDRYQR
jgi:UPF0755 protein